MIPETAQQVAALALQPDRPLVVVDADEVLVHFALPFGSWLERRDWRFGLHEYQLDRAISRADGSNATALETHHLIMDFIADQTLHQPATAGAAATLASIARQAQIVVLTNVPLPQREHRQINLAGHAMAYPVIVNEGPKGPALAEFACRVTAPIAFIDDNPGQIDSAAVHAPHILRFQFTGCDLVRAVLPPANSASLRPQNWTELQNELSNFLA